jgi:hypothetical protein
MRCILKSFCVSTIFLLAVSGTVQAQGAASGSGEVSGNVGFSSPQGADNNRGHVFFGASAAYNLSPVIAVGFEYKYQMLGSLTEDGVTASEHLQFFGPVARFSFANSSHVVPYVLVDGGYTSLHATATAGSVTASASQSGAYFGGGGGASIYIGTNWGIRPEFRYDRLHFDATTVDGEAVASSGANDAQGSVALFFQFGGKRFMKR